MSSLARKDDNIRCGSHTTALLFEVCCASNITVDNAMRILRDGGILDGKAVHLSRTLITVARHITTILTFQICCGPRRSGE